MTRHAQRSAGRLVAAAGLAGSFFALAVRARAQVPAAAEAPAPAAATAPAEPTAPLAPNATSPAQDSAASDTSEETSPGAHTAPTAPSPAASSADTPPPAAAPALSPERPAARDDGLPGTYVEHFVLALAVRESYVSHPGYDWFSSKNGLPQVSLSAGRAFALGGPLAVAALVDWDWGTVDGEARDAKTTLTLNRLTLGAEGRYHLWRRLYVFGRVMPGALNTSATLEDGVTGLERKWQSWSFTIDLSAGAAFAFAGDARGVTPHPRGWVSAEGGYGFAETKKLSLNSPSGEGPARTAALELGELALRGGFFRIGAAITF